MKLSEYIDTLSDAEYNDFIQEFSETEQERIRFYFRPTKEDNKAMQRYIRQYF